MSPFLHDLAAQQLARVVTPAQLDTEYILESLRQASPMLQNMSTRYNLEFDDLYQESYLVAHKIMSDPRKLHTRPYLQSAIKLHVYDMLRHRPSAAASLDAPLSDGEDLALIDLLVEPAKPQQTRRDYYRKRALLKALRQLPEHYQRAITLLCGIDALKIAPHKSIARRTSQSYRSKALGQLRNDARLTTAITGTWK